MADPTMKAIFDVQKNPYGRQWVTAIEDMYRFRCQIVHDGATTATATAIDPLKVDWYFHLASFLNERLQYMLFEGIATKVASLPDFWNSFAVPYLYSPDSRWIKNGAFIDKVLISHNWQLSRLPVW